MTELRNLSRRMFLQLSGTGAAAFVIGVQFPGCTRREGTLSAAFRPNVFITLSPNGDVTIIANRAEMGQGIRTGLSMIGHLVEIGVPTTTHVAGRDLTNESAPILEDAAGVANTGGGTHDQTHTDWGGGRGGERSTSGQPRVGPGDWCWTRGTAWLLASRPAQ